MFARERCTVSDVLVQLDVLAGRQAIRRAGRGEEYDHPMTGKLVKTADDANGQDLRFENDGRDTVWLMLGQMGHGLAIIP